MTHIVDAVEKRNKRGDWNPPDLLETPPVLVWPPQPVTFLKWLFGYGGYLWPWNAVYLLISLLTFWLVTPTFETCRTWGFGWVSEIFLRNEAILIGFYSLWHVRLYVQKAQGTKFKYSNRWLAENNPIFLFGNQVLDNIFYTLVFAVPVWTAFEVGTLWGQANGYFPYISWSEHPVYCAILLLLIPAFRDLHFYLIHRLIHWPPFYKYFHSLHHKNVNPGPWSGLAMHPVEHVLYFSGVMLHWVVPSHPFHVVFHLQHLALGPAQGHSGYEAVVLAEDTTLDTDAYMHYLHHKFFEVNYGASGLVPFDRWFGTFHDGSTQAEDAMNERFRRNMENRTQKAKG